MLVECPECDHRVSDRAAACPQCGFPIAEEIAAAKARAEDEAERTQRERVGDVDCATCNARGFVTDGPEDKPGPFMWCSICEHSGRVPLVRSPKGYWAVAYPALEGFLGGADASGPEAVFLGAEAPQGHRYPAGGDRHPEDGNS